jgi:acyl carrier protein
VAVTIELVPTLRYTGIQSLADGSADWGLLRASKRGGRLLAKSSKSTRELPMSSTFETIANIIAETCDIPRDSIKPESHAINDLGIDSLDFLDIAFAIDKAFGIKLPLEQWTQEVNDGKATTDQYFVLKNLSARIDELVAAKGA